MGVDFYFLKTYVPEQAKHPNRLMNKLEKANILFHQLDHDKALKEVMKPYFPAKDLTPSKILKIVENSCRICGGR